MLTIGDVTIARIEEVVLHEPTALFAQWNAETLAQYRDLLVPHCFDAEAGAFLASIHSYLVKTPRQTILIDASAGNHKPRPAAPRFDQLETSFLARLAAAGVQPEDIDFVICTHLHVDHVGWNTRQVDGRWVPTFPNARYLFSRTEVEWRDPERGAADRPPATHLPFLDSVQPVIDAGLAVLVEGDEEFSEQIDFIPTPGHAPGQFAVRVRSRGEEAMLIADVMHQPVQVFEPAWNSKYCEDPAIAAQTRRQILDYCADRPCLILPGHFGFPHCGTVTRNGDGFAFTPFAGDPNP